MSGRGARGRGGRDNGGWGRGGRRRGHGYHGAKKAPKKGLCTDFGDNVFDYGHKGVADQMRQSWNKLIQYVGTQYDQDICNELQNKTRVVIPTPVHSQAVLTRNTARTQIIRNNQQNIQDARNQRLAMILRQ